LGWEPPDPVKNAPNAWGLNFLCQNLGRRRVDPEKESKRHQNTPRSRISTAKGASARTAWPSKHGASRRRSTPTAYPRPDATCSRAFKERAKSTILERSADLAFVTGQRGTRAAPRTRSCSSSRARAPRSLACPPPSPRHSPCAPLPVVPRTRRACAPSSP